MNHLPKRSRKLLIFFTKQSKRNKGHMMRKHRPTYEVQLFLHMNLSYELMKQGITVSVISTAKDIRDTIYCHC